MNPRTLSGGPSLLVLLALCLSPPLLASPATEAEAFFLSGRGAEAEGRYEDALLAYQDAVDRAPAGVRAVTAAARREWLLFRRDRDGGWDGLTLLEEVREGWRSLPGDEARRRVESLLGTSDLSPTLAVEAHIWLIQDDLERRRDPEGAAFWALSLKLPSQGIPVSTQLAWSQAKIRALARAGKWEEAKTLSPSSSPAAGVPLVERMARDQKRQRMTGMAQGGLAAFLVLALPLAGRTLRRGEARLPLGLLPLGVLLGGAFALMKLWRDGPQRPFLLAAAACVAIHLLSSLAGQGALLLSGQRTSRVVRGAVGVLAAWATGGGIFLIFQTGNSLHFLGL